MRKNAAMSSSRPPRARAKLFAPLSYGGIVGALVFFGFSLTPSLLPRSPLLQGLVSGLSIAGGYGLGALLFWAGARATSWRPMQRGRRIAWVALAAAGIAFVVPALYVSGVWNNQTREFMTLDAVSPWTAAASLPIGLSIWFVLLVIARLLRWAARAVGNLLSRRMPRGAAIVLGAAIIAIPLFVVFSGLLTSGELLADEVYGKTNETTAAGVQQPTSPLRSGGPGSDVTWDSLGLQGRNFIGRGPDAAALEGFSGEPAEEPIRVYVGVESAPTPEERAALAVKELDRTDAWSREVVVVMGTTGTGWIEPQSSDSLEYLWNGDTAEVTIQYSYLPSWISFLVDKERAADAGSALFDQVYARWSELPPESRPRLIAYGLSLGSFASQSAFASVTGIAARTDGALFLGSPSFSEPHGQLEVDRDPGSPQWRPVYQGGQLVRFGPSTDDLAGAGAPWRFPRVVYLQHANDPVVWWDPELILERPDWLEEPPGPDRSPDMVWIPGVTFVQVTIDQFFGTSVPDLQGHNYEGTMVGAWQTVVPASGWSPDELAELEQIVDGLPHN